MAIAQKLAKTLKSILAGCLLLFSTYVSPATQTSPQSITQALTYALKATSAVALVLDANNGKVLAVSQLHATTTLHSTPGSSLKPFFLAYALKEHMIRPEATILCRRTTSIAGRNLTCTHPQSEAVFNAEEALAYSCNSYFIQLASHFSPKEAVHALEDYELTNADGLIKQPATQDQTALFLLGLERITVSPMQLATAYRKLALQLSQPDAQALSPVSRGLEDSINYGMAHNARVAQMAIAGKTGTASDPGQPWTHGWFAGFAPASSPKFVIVIYLPHGNGADAAHLAQRFFQNYKDLSSR